MHLVIGKRTLLVSLVIALALISSLFSMLNTATDAGMTSKWRTQAVNNADNVTAEWHAGAQASLGLTKQQLVFELEFLPQIQSDYLVITPAYLDKAVVQFFDINGQLVQTQIKGDRTLDLNLDQNLDHSFDIGRLVFTLPESVTSATLTLSATENLQANVKLVQKEQLIRDNYLSLIFKSTILMIIAFAAMAGLVAWILTKQTLYGVFGIHQILWFSLLLEFSYFVPSIYPGTAHLNSVLFGATIISTTVTAAAFHWQLLRQLARATWLDSAFFLTVIISTLNLMLFIWGDQHLSLLSNSITIVIATLSFIIAIPLTPAINHRQGLILRKIKWGYALLMLFVVLATLSRLGFGNGSLLPMTYVFALITMLLLGYMLLIRNAVQRRQKENALARGRSLVASNNQLNKHVDEQSALLSMLSHEIKTPLSTLKLLIFESPIHDQLSFQLRSIEGVVDTVTLMDRIKSDFNNDESFDISTLIQQQWQRVAKNSQQTKQLHCDIDGNSLVVGNRLAMEVVVKNLLSNAHKYSVTPLIKARMRRQGQDVIVEVENACESLAEIDMGLLTNKYYRADKTSDLRGTGLGLWICQTLCDANGIQLTLNSKDNVFTAAVKFGVNSQ